MAVTDISVLLNSINKLAANLSNNDYTTRDRLLSQIESLRLAVETPMETIFRIGYQPWQHSAIRLAIDLDIFDILLESGDAGLLPKDMARKTGADEVLLMRILRMLVALGLCSGNPIDGYKANSKTSILTVPQGRDSFKIWADLGAPTANHLTKYFQTHGYNNPKIAEESPFASAFGDEFWTWKSKNPYHSAVFDSFMASRRVGRPDWFDVYPLKDQFLPSLAPEGVAIVDVGGNRGHDLAKLRTRYPELNNRLILQDLPEVLSEVQQNPEGIELMAHNFFQPQPVKGAQIYFFRAIFHDWPTESCQQILKHVADAMEPGVSKLLISDFVLDDDNPHVFSASLDLQMMGYHTGMERSELQWQELLKSAGLEICNIWQRNRAGESVIEAKLSASHSTNGNRTGGNHLAEMTNGLKVNLSDNVNGID